jgi:integrase
MDEIEQAIAAGDKSASWENLFLGEEEIRGLLEYVEENAKHPFICPMIAFAALTGARRSEIVRSQVSDIDLSTRQVWIRERKRVKDVSESQRVFPMCNLLAKVLEEWLTKHPGGSYTFCLPDNLERSRRKTSEPKPLTKDTATDHFKRTLAGSDKWSKIRGFHILRHSVASLLASKGTPQSVINGLMGHSTEEMARRYRHLYPKERTAAVSVVFGFDNLVENGS